MPNFSERCESCGRMFRVKPSMKCASLDHRINRGAHMMEQYHLLRKEILVHYGGKCACCGYSDLEKRVRGRSFLQIDHISGGGSKHHKEITTNLYSWLKKSGFPVGFRVLCGACNTSMEYGEPICEFHKWRDESSRR